VLAAAEAAAGGADLPRVLAVGAAAREHSRFFFVPSTLEHLRRGGRIGNAAALAGSLLQIKPILHVGDDGKVSAWRKVRTQRRAIEQILEEFDADTARDGLGELFAIHSEAEGRARELAGELAQRTGRPVPVLPVSSVVAVHAGGDAVGIGYTTDLTRFLP
jgi:DegV family protein with EDD domain